MLLGTSTTIRPFLCFCSLSFVPILPKGLLEALKPLLSAEFLHLFHRKREVFRCDLPLPAFLQSHLFSSPFSSPTCPASWTSFVIIQTNCASSLCCQGQPFPVPPDLCSISATFHHQPPSLLSSLAQPRNTSLQVPPNSPPSSQNRSLLPLPSFPHLLHSLQPNDKTAPTPQLR